MHQGIHGSFAGGSEMCFDCKDTIIKTLMKFLAMSRNPSHNFMPPLNLSMDLSSSSTRTRGTTPCRTIGLQLSHLDKFGIAKTRAALWREGRRISNFESTIIARCKNRPVGKLGRREGW